MNYKKEEPKLHGNTEHLQTKGNVNTEGFIGRPLTDHKNNKFNRECIEVKTADLRATDGAHHKYRIEVYAGARTAHDTVEGVEAVEVCELNFQNGGLKEVGANGITDQALLAIILDRVRSFNEGQFRCRENSMIITKGEEMMMWMEKRSNDRARRGVEGERIS
jgi:hypothetical protein